MVAYQPKEKIMITTNLNTSSLLLNDSNVIDVNGVANPNANFKTLFETLSANASIEEKKTFDTVENILNRAWDKINSQHNLSPQDKYNALESTVVNLKTSYLAVEQDLVAKAQFVSDPKERQEIQDKLDFIQTKLDNLNILENQFKANFIKKIADQNSGLLSNIR